MSASTVVVLCTSCLLIAVPAYAYVDPGTGGMLVQLVTGGVAGGLILLRLYWRRLKSLVMRTPPEAESSQEPAGTSRD